MLSDREIEHRFSPHSAVSEIDVQEQILGHQIIQEKFTELAKLLNRLLPDASPRLISRTMIGLEETAMWANKAHSSRYPISEIRTLHP